MKNASTTETATATAWLRPVFILCLLLVPLFARAEIDSTFRRWWVG